MGKGTVSMTDAAERAERLKAEGNDLYKQGKYLKAAATYTQALKLDDANAVLYRCARPPRGPPPPPTSSLDSPPQHRH